MIIGSFINLYFVICEKRSETVLRELLNVVVGLAGPELGDIGSLVLLLVQTGHGGGVQGGAGHKILLPGDLIGGMGLRLPHRGRSQRRGCRNGLG